MPEDSDVTAPAPATDVTSAPPAPGVDSVSQLRSALISLCYAIAAGRGRQEVPAILAGLGVPPPPEKP